MIYLTWGTGYTGIFSSQVVDVLEKLNKISNTKSEIKLVSFIPYIKYRSNKQLIKKNYPNSFVLPMIPSRNRWWPFFSPALILLVIFLGERKIMARGVLATNLALILKKIKLIQWVCYDGRGAEKAEWLEYDVVKDKRLETNIAGLENSAIQESDFRLAVSNELVKYWESEYNYTSKAHIIVPCTVNSTFTNIELDKTAIVQKRLKMGFDSNHVVVVFSGGADLWQSIDDLNCILLNLLSSNINVQVILLSNLNTDLVSAFQEYPNRIMQKWVKPNEVVEYLYIADYGILYRQNSITNRVASPTKFAEYLSCGLKVIVSPYVGDYSSLIKNNKLLGIVTECTEGPIALPHVTLKEKLEIREYALKNFTKVAYEKEYQTLLKNSRLK